MTGVETLARRYVDSLRRDHPRPWRVEIDWTIEVYDTNNKIVTTLQSYEAQKTLFEIVKALDDDHAATRALLKDHGIDDLP